MVIRLKRDFIQTFVVLIVMIAIILAVYIMDMSITIKIGAYILDFIILVANLLIIKFKRNRVN